MAQNTLRYVGDVVTTRAFMGDLATLFQAETGVQVRLATGGMQAALDAIGHGRADLLGISRPLREAPGLSDLTHYTIAWDGLVVITRQGNIAHGLSLDALRGVLTGNIDNWSQLGGIAQEIHLYLPASADSGVGFTLRMLLFDDLEAELAADLTYANLKELQTAVAAMPGSLGVTTFSRVKALDSALPVKLLALDGVVATQDSIKAGRYALYMPLYLYASADNALAKRFVEFAQGSLAKRIMRRGHIVPYMDGFKLIARQFERANRLHREAQAAGKE